MIGTETKKKKKKTDKGGLDQVLGLARAIVVPSHPAASRVHRVAEKVYSRVVAAAAGKAEVTRVVVGGSFAKDTWLPDRPGEIDIDIFVGFSPWVETSRFEEVGLSIGREAVRGHKHGKKYAQHPYTEAVVDGFKVNIVPYYEVERGAWKSAADRSVHHLTFVEENLDDEAKFQVRLLKRFMKTLGVYGAEIEKEGFSGYATEALIHEHKTFEAVLRSFAEVQPREVVGEHFTLLDPIDSGRDLARAISRETVARMILASRAFLEKPGIEFFKKVTRVKRPGLVWEVYALEFEHRKMSEDTLWGELKRSTRQIAKRLEEEGFTVARFGAATDGEHSSAILLLPEVDVLSTLEKRVGPPVEQAEGARKFTMKNHAEAKLLWVGEDGRLRLLREREWKTLPKFLDALLGQGIRKVGVSKEVADAISRNGRVLHGRTLRREMANKSWLKGGVSALLSDDVGT